MYNLLRDLTMSAVNHNTALPFASIVVPTLNRKSLLKNCLDSLFQMDYPSSAFEVIVVDGGSTDGTKEMIETTFPGTKYVLEKRRGRSIARNVGWKNAKGQIVAYTDDDCVVDKKWLKTLVSGFDSKKIGAVGGPLLLLSQPESIHNRFKGTPVCNFDLGDKRIVTDELVTANLVVKREAFETNRFDEAFVYDLEDIDFCRSLIDTGYTPIYLPNAKVYHNINPKRLTVLSVLRRTFLAGISLYSLERKRNSQSVLPSKLLRKFLGGFYQFLLRRTLGDFFWSIKCLIAFFTSITSFMFVKFK